MQSISKPTLKVVNYEKNVGNTRLELGISGPNIDYVVTNTIRRTILSDVPIYAFTQFKFNKNTSVFNNNYMKLNFNNIKNFIRKAKFEFSQIKLPSSKDKTFIYY